MEVLIITEQLIATTIGDLVTAGSSPNVYIVRELLDNGSYKLSLLTKNAISNKTVIKKSVAIVELETVDNCRICKKWVDENSDKLELCTSCANSMHKSCFNKHIKCDGEQQRENLKLLNSIIETSNLKKFYSSSNSVVQSFEKLDFVTYKSSNIGVVTEVRENHYSVIQMLISDKITPTNIRANKELTFIIGFELGLCNVCQAFVAKTHDDIIECSKCGETVHKKHMNDHECCNELLDIAVELNKLFIKLGLVEGEIIEDISEEIINGKFKPGEQSVNPLMLDIWYYQMRSKEEFELSITDQFLDKLEAYNGNFNTVFADLDGRVFSGSRRTEGCNRLHLKVKVEFVDISEQDAWARAMTDNNQRTDISLSAKIFGISKLLDYNETTKAIASASGISETACSSIIYGLHSHDVMIVKLQNFASTVGDISKLETINSLRSKGLYEVYLDKIMSEGLTVKEIRKMKRLEADLSWFFNQEEFRELEAYYNANNLIEMMGIDDIDTNTLFGIINSNLDYLIKLKFNTIILKQIFPDKIKNYFKLREKMSIKAAYEYLENLTNNANIEERLELQEELSSLQIAQDQGIYDDRRNAIRVVIKSSAFDATDIKNKIDVLRKDLLFIDVFTRGINLRSQVKNYLSETHIALTKKINKYFSPEEFQSNKFTLEKLKEFEIELKSHEKDINETVSHVDKVQSALKSKLNLNNDEIKTHLINYFSNDILPDLDQFIAKINLKHKCIECNVEIAESSSYCNNCSDPKYEKSLENNCKKCDLEFTSEKKLVAHNETHHNTCPTCKQEDQWSTNQFGECIKCADIRIKPLMNSQEVDVANKIDEDIKEQRQIYLEMFTSSLDELDTLNRYIASGTKLVDPAQSYHNSLKESFRIWEGHQKDGILYDDADIKILKEIYDIQKAAEDKYEKTIETKSSADQLLDALNDQIIIPVTRLTVLDKSTFGVPKINIEVAIDEHLKKLKQSLLELMTNGKIAKLEMHCKYKSGGEMDISSDLSYLVNDNYQEYVL